MMTIWCTGQFAAIHSYPEAKSDVAYLRHEHRHIFHFKIELQVSDYNREIEFIRFKNDVLNFCGTHFSMYPTTYSCEQMCDMLRGRMFEDMGVEISRLVSITVSEDGENGATWYRD